MKRVVIIGCPGSGKSTFARGLSSVTGLPLYYLDLIYHRPDRTTIARELFDEKLEEILKQESWIIDGNYARTMEKRVSYCDTVFYLDLSLDDCLTGISQRVGKEREDMPWIEHILDEKLVEVVNTYHKKNDALLAYLQKTYAREWIVINSRKMANDYLEEINYEHDLRRVL